MLHDKSRSLAPLAFVLEPPISAEATETIGLRELVADSTESLPESLRDMALALTRSFILTNPSPSQKGPMASSLQAEATIAIRGKERSVTLAEARVPSAPGLDLTGSDRDLRLVSTKSRVPRGENYQCAKCRNVSLFHLHYEPHYKTNLGCCQAF
jgi:hypothetical protein